MRGYLTYCARRVGQFLFVVFAGVTIAFVITHLTPIDPVEQVISNLTASQSTDPAAIELMRQSLSALYGLEGSLWNQFLTFWSHVLAGGFGPSLSAYPTPVTQLIGNALPWTVGLMTTAILVAWLLGNILGSLAGYYRDSRLLRVAGIVIMAVHPIPYYVLGLILLICFGYLWPVLPIAGGAQINMHQGFSLEFLGSIIRHALLPALSLVLVGVGGWFLGMRSLVSNVITEDYVVYAQLANVRSARILGQYVVRNAIVPQVTGLAMSLGHAFGGAIIIEKLFGYPGVGKLLVDAVQAGDYSLVLGVTTVSIIGVATAVLVIDLLYPLIDPRMKMG